jgi:N-ethylmaleimide reductase
MPNRARFLLDTVDAVASAIGADRLGVRLSPFGQYGGISDTHPQELFAFVIGKLSERKLAYLHLIEARGSELGLTDELHANAPDNAELFGMAFAGPLISAAAYTPDSAAEAVRERNPDAIAFGRLFIANSDLVRRIQEGRALNAPDRSTFYGGDAHGYTDYPVLGDAP